MKTTEYIKKIKNYVAIDEVNFALKEFMVLVHGTALHDEVVLLSARFSDFLRHVRNDIITFDQAKVTKAKIRYDLLELLKQVENNKDAFEQGINKAEREYLQIMERYYADMPVKELDKLSRDLKRLGQTLFELDFITDRLHAQENPGVIFGALCAIQVNPNPKYYGQLVNFLNEISEDDNLLNIRLRIVFRLVMCVENIVNIDNNRLDKEISTTDREAGIQALEKLANHQRCQLDDALNRRIGRTIKKIKK